MVHTTIYWKTLSALGPMGVALRPEPTSLGWTGGGHSDARRARLSSARRPQRRRTYGRRRDDTIKISMLEAGQMVVPPTSCKIVTLPRTHSLLLVPI